LKKMLEKAELELRLDRFIRQMDKDNPGWEMCIIVSKVNQYYFTGTMQDGILVIPKIGRPILWVRRAYQRAVDESSFSDIFPMNSFHDAAAYYPSLPDIVHTETRVLTVDLYSRLAKHFSFKKALSLDNQISLVRAVKSDFEIELLTESGKIHQHVLKDIVPTLLVEGVSEKNFFGELYNEMIKAGYHGISRFSMFETECIMGQVGFGENSVYPHFFNGPGGQKGLNAAVPGIGDEKRFLKKGDLVFVDIGCGYQGYHTDCTNTYVFNGELPKKAVDAHKRCVELRERIVARLKPGEIPSKIYSEIMESLDAKFLSFFMGMNGNQVKFLGHGVGLHVDEFPVIAKGFDMPLEENMVLAIEPKCAIKGVGTVGVEDTFFVTKSGGKCLTGNSEGLTQI